MLFRLKFLQKSGTPVSPFLQLTQRYSMNLEKLNQGKQRKKIMIKRFIQEDSGMEMVEWAIVGVLFAVAGAAFWGTLATNVGNALGQIQGQLNGGGGQGG